VAPFGQHAAHMECSRWAASGKSYEADGGIPEVCGARQGTRWPPAPQQQECGVVLHFTQMSYKRFRHLAWAE